VLRGLFETARRQGNKAQTLFSVDVKPDDPKL
jgi:hypothetical protein